MIDVEQVQLSVKEVNQLLQTDSSVVLLDVRGLEEHNKSHITIGQLLTEELGAEILAEWDKETKMIFYCHHGLRSLQAAYFFIEAGFSHARSMGGGIDAWSQEVDASVPRYISH